MQSTEWNARLGEQLAIFWRCMPKVLFTLAATAAFLLRAGQYALALWADYAVVQLAQADSEPVRSARLGPETSTFAAGIPTSGTFVAVVTLTA